MYPDRAGLAKPGSAPKVQQVFLVALGTFDSGRDKAAWDEPQFVPGKILDVAHGAQLQLFGADDALDRMLRLPFAAKEGLEDAVAFIDGNARPRVGQLDACAARCARQRDGARAFRTGRRRPHR